VSGTYHSTSTDGYQLRIAVLVVKNNTTNKDNIRKGDTMQLITINLQYPTCTCTIHHMQNKIKPFMLAPQALHALGLALLRVKLLKTYGLWTSGNLLSTFSTFRTSPPTSGPTRDDNVIY
jgi:hypothetical protein